VLELCRHYPKLLSNKWCIVTAFDYSELVPPGESEGGIYKDLNDKPFKFEAVFELPSSGNGDEYYFFDEQVDVSTLKILTEVQPFDNFRLSEIDLSTLDKNFNQLNEVNAIAYKFNGQYQTLIFKSPMSVQKFIDSSHFRGIPDIHIAENAAYIRSFRNAPTSNAKCAQKGCKGRSILYGVNCPRHHYQMLHGDENLSELFDEPIPGGEFLETPSQDFFISDKTALKIASALGISFIIVLTCYVLCRLFGVY